MEWAKSLHKTKGWNFFVDNDSRMLFNLPSQFRREEVIEPAELYKKIQSILFLG
jgi:hypothetical protein